MWAAWRAVLLSSTVALTSVHVTADAGDGTGRLGAAAGTSRQLATANYNQTAEPHHTLNATVTDDRRHGKRREKRFLAYNFDEKRITLPPGTLLFITPTLNLPLIRNLKKGFNSDLTISLPFKITFDSFGITDEFNPWGIIPGLSQPQVVDEEVRRRRRFRRSLDDYTPHPLGDRVLLFEALEGHLANMGHNGRDCVLRAICETHEHPLPYHGLFGEILQLLLRVSETPFADETLPEHLEAERAGAERSDCGRYRRACPLSLYSTVSDNKRRFDQLDMEELQKLRTESAAQRPAAHGAAFP